MSLGENSTQIKQDYLQWVSSFVVFQLKNENRFVNFNYRKQQSDPCLLYMVTFSDLKGRKEYILCMKTQRRCARHKQVKTLRRHLKSYITLCNITSCNIIEKWKNRPATVCALRNLMQYYLMQYYGKIDWRQFACYITLCNITLCNIMEKSTGDSLRVT